jgi:hypothetical protein
MAFPTAVNSQITDSVTQSKKGSKSKAKTAKNKAGGAKRAAKSGKAARSKTRR